MDENNDATETNSEAAVLGGLPLEPDSSMQEYYQLQNELLLLSISLMVVGFVSVWMAYSLTTALNYLIGACSGVVYLKLLARSVEKLGRSASKVSKNQLALFIGVIVVASQLDQLQIVPVFLGFLTYKAALIAYMFKALSTT
ncbi:ATP synthase subunit I [Leptothoe kymatousa]|uniref:ATP synthase subunit I n=1 Tax=Leptothoe kymatousa TAU-MAC 1615 TaxID=2364775 RepID=A0ABS5Y5E0_9CYAN|nr:ATP synthase subunit I [Leptothoe kymatousa]MBT9313054.1 ATP synthase subunit I [Leptothoe kymatousa TAU-MAC 1615]